MLSKCANMKSFYNPGGRAKRTSAKAVISLTQVSQCLQSVVTKNSDSSIGTAPSECHFGHEYEELAFSLFSKYS